MPRAADFMKIPELELEKILNVPALRKQCDKAASIHAEDNNALRSAILAIFKDVNAQGRKVAEDMLLADGSGLACAKRISWLQDQLITVLYEFALKHIFSADKAPAEVRLAIAAVGGYGRGTLAPGSDIDLLFILPDKSAAWQESAIEYILYVLWDMGLKVGHATRKINECIRLSKTDMTIRTAILESRFICGEQPLLEELETRFDKEVVRNTGAEFIAAKLAERDERHRKSGDTRYLVEPNVKEGKGGLRDLHTLFWISKYYYRVRSADELVSKGVLSRRELNLFRKCEDFLWAVRCHMHFATGKAEERLSFDIQSEIATRLDYHPHPGLSAVERFMKHYFWVAKNVGDLTRILAAGLEERQVKEAPGLSSVLSRFANRVRRIAGSPQFVEDRGRIALAEPDVFKKDPLNLIRLFHVAGIHGLEFHPDALTRASRSLSLIDAKVRNSEEANRVFLSILTSRANAAEMLGRMNEAGVLGRFIPEFGKIVSMMQFNMYHHYTVDEHLLRTVGVLAKVEGGEEDDAHPLAHKLMPSVEDRTVLYVAALLHDIAKGRPEDHSVAGAKVARKLCPRLGLSPKQTEMVAWLIQEHLTMSMTAQTRDLNDWKTINDFAEKMQSMERLRMLLILTVCDIRAVGPGVWNGWKGQLLRTLYYETELRLSGGHSNVTRKERAEHAREVLKEALAEWGEADAVKYSKLPYEPYLLSVQLEDQVRHAGFIRQADKAGKRLASAERTHSFHAITEITILAPDHPRLLAIITGACAAAGANIADANIYTTSDGRALDTILINREFDNDEDEHRRAATISRMIEDVLSGKKRLPEVIATRAKSKRRANAFDIAPSVSFSNELSNRFTVVEIECLDRIGLLSEITAVFSDLSLDIASAHITTFGEKVIDTFYVTDLVGQKVTNENRQANAMARLKAVLANVDDEARSSMPSGIIAPPREKGRVVKKAKAST